jgi:23S rRNA (pseudouridine1915-N3)-methyltransferase
MRIVAVGKVKERYLLDGIAEYEKRLRPYCRLEWHEIRDSGLKAEASAIGKFLGPDTYLLDVGGRKMSSQEFAQFIKRQTGKQITFVIGSAEGVDSGIKDRCQAVSLSDMTFTHDMCRLFLIEQIYRAHMIINNRGYHK